MKNNVFMGQLIGPFKANEELYTRIKEDAATAILYVHHLGIQAPIGTIIYINKKPYEIGKTGLYEIGNTRINSLYFQSDTDNNILIDYTVLTEY